MLLANLLDARAIVHESRILSREQVYQELVERICRYHNLPICGSALLNMILERDQEASTAYPTGIAIPHIRMENYHDTVVGMAFLQTPLDYDGTKVHWVCLIISDKSSSNLYLNLVAALLRMSKDDSIVQTLASQHDGFGVVQYINKQEIQLKKEITISDVMISEPVTISQNALLAELSTLLCSKNLSFIPVVDDSGHYLGEVNILRLLKVGVPDYLMMLDNLSFLRSYEPLEKLFEQEDVLTVKDIMEKKEEYLTPDASIPEAVFEMIQHHKRFYSVVDDKGKLVGVVTAMDIFRKVIKA
jgi:mannitol/fructose-specific phosphotransferase system IIA component (Ntr-type)/predicted transcriptional regulator